MFILSMKNKLDKYPHGVYNDIAGKAKRLCTKQQNPQKLVVN